MSSSRGEEGQDGIAAVPALVTTPAGDSSSSSSSNIHPKNSTSRADSNSSSTPHHSDAMEASGAASSSSSSMVPVLTVRAPPPDDRPLPPTPNETDDHQAPLPPTPPPQTPPQQQQPQQPRNTAQEYVVPRWQPDSEVLYCPICFVYFGLFTRKHHCRKCGRVVCSSCSPHRIIIPHAFIVQPPDAQQAGGMSAAQAAALLPLSGIGQGVPVGGERVRLCNPCVPDPNTSPLSSATNPGGQQQYQRNNNSHVRARSGSNYDFESPGRGQGQGHGQGQSQGLGLGHGLGLGFGFLSAGSSSGSGGDRRYTVSHAQNAPQNVPAGNSNSHSSGRNHQAHGHAYAYGSLPPPRSRSHRLGLPPQEMRLPFGVMHHPPAAAAPPRHEIPEEDECPVCHRELPSRSLPDADRRREQHIEDCIALHSQYMMGNSRNHTGVVRQRAVSTPSAAPADRSLEGEGEVESDASSSSSPVSPDSDAGSGSGSGSSALAIHRHTALFPYKATAKDCAADAECTICLEDIEVGVAMARLECFCCFHERCIRAWFVRHPGRCPVHQHGMAD